MEYPTTHRYQDQLSIGDEPKKTKNARPRPLDINIETTIGKCTRQLKRMDPKLVNLENGLCNQITNSRSIMELRRVDLSPSL